MVGSSTTSEETQILKTLKYNLMRDELEVEEIVVKREDVDAGDELGARRVEFVVPRVDKELKPKLRMEFDSLDEGYTFYNNYALAPRFEFKSIVVESPLMVNVN
ncbi:S2-RNase [Pyrus ussuriensis x Pyrus communis]|uniref:S2-RNase n=1 Tax=Pyrus ussuriensis x Pyrus communis TaxID=2448454 RepID=A0A5N5GKC2_9ROSA|nr:S2-RNase [Pyrus ussuriensis x Pyrus communis]